MTSSPRAIVCPDLSILVSFIGLLTPIGSFRDPFLVLLLCISAAVSLDKAKPVR
jgi:hypothetical protein